MDADLQHPPEMIADFVRIWQEEDADSVYAYKASRLASEGPVKAALSRAFFWVINRDQRYKIPPGAGDFRLVNRRFMAALRSLPESDRFMKGSMAGSALIRSAFLSSRLPVCGVPVITIRSSYY